MNCPKCHQHETSDNVRFCRRCGFELNEGKEFPAADSREIKGKKKDSTARGVKQGIALMLFGFVLVSILAILNDMGLVSHIWVKIAALVFCIGGIVRAGVSIISDSGRTNEKEDASFQYKPAAQTLAGANVTNRSLPEAQSVPLISLAKGSFDTAEMIEPPSIVENTTKLLKVPKEQK